MAAFANNQGGFLIFGIKDSPREVVGLQGQAFENLTSEKISEFVKSTLSHNLSYEFETLEFDNEKIGWIYTRQSQIKPVICTKTIGNDLKDGVIYSGMALGLSLLGLLSYKKLLMIKEMRRLSVG